MFRSLRFRLPALFLLGVVVSGLIASVIALRLFQSYVIDRSKKELRREAIGLTEVFVQQAINANNTGEFRAITKQLERATGDKLFYVGLTRGARQEQRAHETATRHSRLALGQNGHVRVRPARKDETYLAVARPLRLEGKGPAFGDLVVATPKTELNQQLLPLLERLALASLGGFIVAGLLGWYLSRRITRPVLALSAATDEISRGSYEVELDDVRGGGEIAHLESRFREMAMRLSDAEQQERNFLMSVSHELRTPLTAIRGHVEALREGIVDDPPRATPPWT